VKIGNGKFHVGDCFDVMATLPDASVDMVLCDLPYGTTQNKWDSVLPLDALWKEYWRIAKPNAAIVLTAQPPFDKLLGVSQIHHLAYEWIWEKSKATGHLNAKRQPMKAHENVLVFYRKQSIYNPQKTPGAPYKGNGGGSKRDNYGDFAAVREGSTNGSRYPRSIIKFTHEMKPIHPTQKPVALFEYLIYTYTDEGMTVLDNTAGSGTTAIAAERSNRQWICIERDEGYAAAAQRRIMSHLLGDLA